MPIAFSNPTLEFPSGPLDAVTHPDPYPYYASLAARRPFGYDASLGLGVAAGPQALNNASGTIVTKGQAVIDPTPENSTTEK
ncbi:hypothetical protein [Pandoraea bronchicola]|nr:hypothetical protein [Pandoraea bronchicola]